MGRNERLLEEWQKYGSEDGELRGLMEKRG